MTTEEEILGIKSAYWTKIVASFLSGNKEKPYQYFDRCVDEAISAYKELVKVRLIKLATDNRVTKDACVFSINDAIAELEGGGSEEKTRQMGKGNLDTFNRRYKQIINSIREMAKSV